MKSNSMKNKGMTLVEILVVTAILSIIVGLSAVSISLVFSRDAEGCAKTINMALESVRMSALSQRGDFTLSINSVNNQLVTIASEGPVTTSEALQRQVTVSFPDLPDVEELSIAFDKSTGRVTNVRTDGAAVTPPPQLIRIRCTNNSGSKVATVTLVSSTGKHYVEYGS